MNKQELIDKLKTRFYAVNDTDIYEGNTEAGITVWGIGVFDKVGGRIAKEHRGRRDANTDRYCRDQPNIIGPIDMR